MLENQFNAIHAAINEEIADIRENVTSTEANSTRASYVYADGSVVLPVSNATSMNMIDSTVFNNILESYSNYISNESSLVRDSDIIKVPNANKKLLAAYAKMMVDDGNIGKFYGMIIVDENKKINPLHPMIAAMITAGEIKLSKRFTIIVYPYGSRRYADADIIDGLSRSIVSLIGLIRQGQYLPEVSYEPSSSLESDIRTSSVSPGTCVISFSERGRVVEDAVIPVQLATRGIVYPYYGMILSSRNSGAPYSSKNLYPILSGNIDTVANVPGATCVGGLSNYAFSSLYVLSNMNIESMYFSEVFTAKTDAFIMASQIVSAELLAAAVGIIDTKKGESSGQEE